MRITALMLIALSVLALGCKKKTGGSGSSPTPGPSATPPLVNRPDLNAACNRLSDGKPTAVCKPSGPLRYMPQFVDAVYHVDWGQWYNNGGRPKDPKAWVAEMYKRLDAHGLCGAYDGQRFMVRGQDDTTEYYTFYREKNFRPFVEANTTCVPASQLPSPWDQTTMNFSVKPPCGLPPSTFDENNPNHTCELAKDGAVPVFKPDVLAAIEAVLSEERAHPTGLVDFTQHGPQTDAYRLPGDHDVHAVFLEKVAVQLRGKGYCVVRSEGYTQDGITLKKDTNDLEEYYDLIQGGDEGQAYIRRFFHSNCTPASF